MSDFGICNPKTDHRLLASFAGSQWVFNCFTGISCQPVIYYLTIKEIFIMSRHHKKKNKQPNVTPEAQNMVSNPVNGTAIQNGKSQVKNKRENPSATPDGEEKVEEKRTKRITLRFTPTEYDYILEKAAECGRKKTDYAQSCVTGHLPCYLMTDDQTNALMALGDARADLQNISNALHGQPQEARKKYFKNEYFMNAWINGVNSLVVKWRDIEHYFSNLTITQHNDSEG